MNEEIKNQTEELEQESAETVSAETEEIQEPQKEKNQVTLLQEKVQQL